MGDARRWRRWRLGAIAGAVVALGSVLVFTAASAIGRREPAAAPTIAHDAPLSSRDAPGPSHVSLPSPPDPLVALGRSIFFDTDLSEPRGTSCASCHDPERAFSGSNGSTTGAPRGSRPGHFARRSSPSLLYLKYTPKFHFAQDDDDDIQSMPHGGFFWDGRADSIRELVRQPLLNPDEMNNPNARTIADKIDKAGYADDFRHELGLEPDKLDKPEATLDAVGRALEAFLTSSEMAPFSSKYDAYVTGRGKLTPYEMQGLRLFKDPAKGGCLGCHRFYDTGRDPALSMFTDYGYDALAAPRNDKLPNRHRPDLGLCERTDQQTPSNQPANCVAFRTPSLRNVAVRGSYMHNGVFTNLRDVVAFYATRSTDPKRWYKSGVKFEDVPARFRGQVNVSSIPYNRREGDVPALNDQEIDAIVAFLQTLTDAKYPTPATR